MQKINFYLNEIFENFLLFFNTKTFKETKKVENKKLRSSAIIFPCGNM